MVKKEYIFSCYEAAVNMNQVLHKLNLATHHSIYIRTVSLLSSLLNRFKLVYGTFVQSNMHSTLADCLDQLELVCCKKRQKLVADQLLVCGVGDF